MRDRRRRGSVAEIADDRFGRVADYAWSPDARTSPSRCSDDNGIRSLWIWSAADGKMPPGDRRDVRRVHAGLGSRRGATSLPLRPRVRAADLRHRVELRRQPRDRHLRARVAQGRRAPLPARERRGDARRPRRSRPRTRRTTRTRTKKKGDEGQETRRPKAEKTPKPVEDRLRRPRRAGRPRAGRGRQPTTASRRRRATCSTRRRRRRSTAATATRRPSLRIFDLQEARGVGLVDDVDGWAVSARRQQGPRSQRGRRLQALRRQARRRRTPQEAVSTKELVVDRVPAEEWAADLRRGLAPLPRLLLRRRTCTATTGRRSATATGRCCRYVAHRSDLNYVLGEMVAELNVGHAYIEGGDFELPRAAEGRPPRRAVRARRDGGPLPDREDLPRPQRGGEVPLAAHRGRRRRPRGRLRPRRSTARSCAATTTRTASSSTRPTPGHAHAERQAHARRGAQGRPTSRSRAKPTCSTSTGSLRQPREGRRS